MAECKSKQKFARKAPKSTKRFYSRVHKPTLPTISKLRREKFRKVQQRTASRPGRWLPFLHVLNSMKPEHRIILFEHLDDVSRDRIYHLVTRVLTSTKVPMRKRMFLKSKLSDDKDTLRTVMNPKKSTARKAAALCSIGGGTMTHVLRAALPMVMNLYK